MTLVGEERHLPYERPPVSKGLPVRGGAGGKALVRPKADYATEESALQAGRRAMIVVRQMAGRSRW